MATSSARPDELIAYSAQLFTEAEVVIESNRVGAALTDLEASSGLYLPDLGDIQEEVNTKVRLAQELDVWVGAVGQGFLLAGGGDELVIDIDDDSVIEHLPPGMADPPAESRARAEEGANAFDDLKQACDDRDHDRIEELLELLEQHQDDPAWMAGFAIQGEDVLGDLDELEGMLEDGMRPKKTGGPFGWVVDLGKGVWDSVWGTVEFLYGLTLEGVVNPGQWVDNWAGLGSGLWHGITNPLEFLSAIVDWEGLKDNPARWIGSFVPDLAVTVFSGGAGAVARGGRGLDALRDLARTLRRGVDVDVDNLATAGRRAGLDLDADLADVALVMRQSLIDKGVPRAVAQRIADRIQSGNQFNRNLAGSYPFNEVILSNGRRLDSYDPITGEIVSRKYTQLPDIQYGTARRYIDEIAGKYSPGVEIGTSPSVIRQQEAAGVSIAGERLSGDLILEVPAQVRDVPQDVLDYASSRQPRVIIRTSEGLVLNP